MTKAKATTAPTTPTPVMKTATLLVDFGSYKKGAKVPVIGNDILIDGRAYNTKELCECGIKITTNDALVPVYDEHFMEKLVRHSVEDAQEGRYKATDTVIVYNLEKNIFEAVTMDTSDVSIFPAELRTGLVLPADTTVTKAIRRLANISKAYTLNLSDEAIASAVTSFNGWYVAPTKAPTVSSEEKLANAIEALTTKLK